MLATLIGFLDQRFPWWVGFVGTNMLYTGILVFGGIFFYAVHLIDD